MLLFHYYMVTYVLGYDYLVQTCAIWSLMFDNVIFWFKSLSLHVNIKTMCTENAPILLILHASCSSYYSSHDEPLCLGKGRRRRSSVNYKKRKMALSIHLILLLACETLTVKSN